MTTTPVFDPTLFHIAEGIAHVCAGGETAPLRAHATAFSQYLADKGDGARGRIRQEAMVERARGGIAAMWRVPARDIGFVSSVAEGISLLVESLDWHEGDSIAVDLNEYPSVVAPFAAGLRNYPTLRLAQGKGPDRIAAAVDRSTRVIAVSYVSYLNGERVDLPALRRLADSVGALLVVDFTQASGYLPIEASVADFAFCAIYKWMLGITGTAIAYWNSTRQPSWAPTTAGWYSIASGARPDWRAGVALRSDAGVFTRGNPSHAGIYVLCGALDFLARHDMAAVQAHVQGMTTALHDRFTGVGIQPSTPRDPARHGASICVDTPHNNTIVEAMQAQGILAWGGRGRVRFSFHGYNSAEDVERIAAAFPPLLIGAG
jgi:cysteine desulfurase/selenocysteine lyase